MKHVAVVGFENLKDFRDWAYKRILENGKDSLMGSDYYINENDKIEYRCILCKKDMKNRKFDDCIQVDKSKG